MTNKLTLLAVLLCTVLSAAAETFKIKWGPEYKKEGGLWSWDYLLGSDDKYFYAMSDPRGKANILKFDFTGKLITSTPLVLPTGKGKPSVSDMIRLGTKTYLLLTSRDKKADVINYFGSEMKNGSFNNTTLKNFYAFSDEFSFVGAQFNKSPKGKYMATLLSSRGKNKEEVIKVIVFDDQLKIAWEKTYPLAVADRNIALLQYIVDDEGNVYLAAKHYDSKEAYKKGLPKYKFTAYKLTSGGINETIVDLGGDKAPWDAGLFPASDGGVYIGGFYTKTNTSKGSADGVFISEVRGGKAKSNSYAFSKEFLAGLQSKRQERKDEGITSYSVDYLVRFPDGSLTFIAEQYYITTHTVSNGKTTTTYYVYHSEEVVVPRFDADGKLTAMEKVDKVFSSRNQMVTSYSFFVKDNSVALVYNDFKNREERKASGKGRAIYTDISYFSGNGKVITENIFTSKDVEKFYIPSASMDLGNGRHVVKAIRGKTYTYGIITP